MAKINLLPWREERRKEQQTEFFIILGICAVVGVMLWGTIHLYHNLLIQFQEGRNQYISTQIERLDKKIEEIRRLEKEKARLLARMRAIELLQGNRPLIVRLFDELVRSLPEGVSVNNVTQKDTKITIEGVAQSNARVSSFMRNLDSNDWLKDPELDIVQAKDAEGTRISNFTLRFSQVIPSASAEEDQT
jgi:type IV pilus assembly protein PilN